MLWHCELVGGVLCGDSLQVCCCRLSGRAYSGKPGMYRCFLPRVCVCVCLGVCTVKVPKASAYVASGRAGFHKGLACNAAQAQLKRSLSSSPLTHTYTHTSRMQCCHVACMQHCARCEAVHRL